MNHKPFVSLHFHGHRFEANADASLYWPALHMLIVSDLHFGKGASLSRQGHPIPTLDSLDTLTRLAACIDRLKPQQVVCLGDSFHDRAAEASLPQEEKAKLCSLVASVKHWTWIVGNHDPDLPATLPGERRRELVLDKVLLTHEPASHKPQIIGHFHPKTAVRVGGRPVRGKCFIAGNEVLMLPAFGSYTGGLNITDPAITRVVGRHPDRYLIYQRRVWPLKPGT